MLVNDTITIDFNHLPRELAHRVLAEDFDVFRYTYYPDYLIAGSTPYEDVWLVYISKIGDKLPIDTKDTLNELLLWCHANSASLDTTKAILIVS